MKTIKWRYALGEILIVIIGITAAFSLNKCAENRKDNTLKKQYLQSLKNDIESDRLQLQGNVEKLTEKLSAVDSVTVYLKARSDLQPGFMAMFMRVSTLTEFNAKDITYSSLIHSGDMKLIDDLSLRTRIEEHYSKNYKKLQSDYERMVNIHKKYLADYYIDHINYDAINKGVFILENKKRLKNILYSIRGAIYIKMASTKQSIESCNSTLAAVETSLDGL